jgi:predicted nucleic acid-binding protein
MSSGDYVAEVESPAIVVCDAGPLIHLDELGCIDLLSDFRKVLVPDAVWNEVARHRPSALRHRSVRLHRVNVTASREAELIKLAKAFSLGAGEFESLVLMGTLPDAILLTDDAEARIVATKLNYEVHGTIAILVRALQRQQRTKRQVLNLLRAIPRRSTLYISQSLLNSVIGQIRSS